MSSENKTRLEVQKILRSNILTALDKLKLEGWGVMEFANASFQKADKIILYNLINVDRLSWNGVEYGINSETGEFERIDEWLEQQMWQISTICKRTDDTDDADILAEDVANRLIAWFNGPGCDLFRRNGMANLIVDNETVFVYNDNSNLYQKRSVFTVKIQVPKKQKYEQESATLKGITTRPI